MNKQIEEKRELVDILYWSGYGFDRGTCNDLARQIYEQGYRKQEDVAREIFAELKTVMMDEYRYPIIAELKNKYGVAEE